MTDEELKLLAGDLDGFARDVATFTLTRAEAVRQFYASTKGDQAASDVVRGMGRLVRHIAGEIAQRAGGHLDGDLTLQSFQKDLAALNRELGPLVVQVAREGGTSELSVLSGRVAAIVGAEFAAWLAGEAFFAGEAQNEGGDR